MMLEFGFLLGFLPLLLLKSESPVGRSAHAGICSLKPLPRDLQFRIELQNLKTETGQGLGSWEVVIQRTAE